MSRPYPRRLATSLLLAAVVAVAGIASSNLQPPVATAQSMQQSVSGRPDRDCNGSPVPSGRYCCPNGNMLPIGAMCTNSGPPSPPGGSISYASGWNVVAGPTGTVINGNANSLYAWPSGSSNYQVLPAGSPLTAGQGYWAYFPGGGSATLAPAGPNTVTVGLPAGQWVLIGNPGTGSATVSGADVVFTYAGGGYQQTNTLPPGMGGWALSSFGGQAIISSS